MVSSEKYHLHPDIHLGYIDKRVESTAISFQNVNWKKRLFSCIVKCEDQCDSPTVQFKLIFGDEDIS